MQTNQVLVQTQPLVGQVQANPMAMTQVTQPMLVCVPGTNLVSTVGQVLMPVMTFQQQLAMPNMVNQIPQQVNMLPCMLPTFQGSQTALQTPQSCAPVTAPFPLPKVEDYCDSDSEMVSRKVSTIQTSELDVASTTSKDTIEAIPPLKSTSATPVSGLAGAIAKRIREHGCVDIISSGVDGSNQAVKAMALARTFLVQEGKTISSQPELAEGGTSAPGAQLRFHCQGISLTDKDLHSDDENDKKLDVIIRVSANSVIRKTAGAIAKLVRGPGNSGQTIGILTMGAESVAITAQAVTTARSMLEQDYLDISFNPKFIHVNDEHSLQPKPALQLALKVTRK
eukprot:TRINITY_DN26280_c0_g1_i1.p1 TRINITY_DN26280_c0_g1~~TRINITY_DN26280_c0_g1_i1.p1  ORF type:complete len:339 (+),score=60.82 TRINITY_DN26280_c0_g1_i1:55-1071(+)